MAGRGPAPKDAGTRARRNADPVGVRIVDAVLSEQLPLPELMPNGDPWPRETVRWWAMWGASPLAGEFTANDWSELLDTAVLHGAYWAGDLKHAGELRLRVAKYGATPEDRARLRIQFASANEADDRQARKGLGAARSRRGPLRGG